jgi:hypothetical protein
VPTQARDEIRMILRPVSFIPAFDLDCAKDVILKAPPPCTRTKLNPGGVEIQYQIRR